MAPLCGWSDGRSRWLRSRRPTRPSWLASPGTSATGTRRCRWSAIACASAAIMCSKRCWLASVRGSPPSRRRSSPSAALITIIMSMIMGRKRRAGQTGGSLRGHLMVRDAELRSAPHHEVDQAHRERSPLILRSRASFDSHPHSEEPAKRASRRMRVTAQDEERGVSKGEGASAKSHLAPSALYRLMAWLSPSYPVGAFSYSGGLEWAVEAGDVTDAESLQRWLAVVIGAGGGFCDAVFLVHSYRAVAADEDAALRAVAELGAAFAPSKERHLESTAQGRAFFDATRAAWPCAALDRLIAGWDGPIAYPVAVGVAAAGHGVPVEPGLAAYLQAVAANLVSAGVRLIPLGQTDGQRVVAALEAVVAATV